MGSGVAGGRSRDGWVVRGEGVCAWDRGLGWVSRKALVSFFFLKVGFAKGTCGESRLMGVRLWLGAWMVRCGRLADKRIMAGCLLLCVSDRVARMGVHVHNARSGGK